jgi:hypothetical protein
VDEKHRGTLIRSSLNKSDGNLRASFSNDFDENGISKMEENVTRKISIISIGRMPSAPDLNVYHSGEEKKNKNYLDIPLNDDDDSSNGHSDSGHSDSGHSDDGHSVNTQSDNGKSSDSKSSSSKPSPEKPKRKNGLAPLYINLNNVNL